MSEKFELRIDISVVAPGHGKYTVDGLNPRDKIFIREETKNIYKDIASGWKWLGMVYYILNTY